MRYLTLLAIALLNSISALAQSTTTDVVFPDSDALIRLNHYTENGRDLVKFSDCKIAARNSVENCTDLALMTERQFKTMETCDMMIEIADMIGFGVSSVGGVISVPFTMGLSLVPGAAGSAYAIHSFNEAESQDSIYFYNNKEGQTYAQVTHDEFISTLKKSLQRSWTSCHVNGQLLSN